MERKVVYTLEGSSGLTIDMAKEYIEIYDKDGDSIIVYIEDWGEFVKAIKEVDKEVI